MELASYPTMAIVAWGFCMVIVSVVLCLEVEGEGKRVLKVYFPRFLAVRIIVGIAAIALAGLTIAIYLSVAGIYHLTHRSDS